VETARCTHRNDKNNDYNVGCKIMKRRKCLEDPFIDGWIILKCNLKNWVSGYKLDLQVSVSNTTSHLNTLISKIFRELGQHSMMTSLWAGWAWAWIKAGERYLCYKISRLSLWAILPPTQWVLGTLFPGESDQCGRLSTYLTPVPRLTMSSAIPPFPYMLS